MASENTSELMTYGAYLRVPELLQLQTPVGTDVHDEMLFIILQQVQELWFKQMLHDLRAAINFLDGNEVHAATRLLERVNRILHALNKELEVMETLSPTEFLRFRGLLKPSSGFESFQFRELELASGLRDPSYLRFVNTLIDTEWFRERWPRSLHDAFVSALESLDSDPVKALVSIYARPGEHASYHALAEAVSDYELRFADWRFHHVQLVERIIGNRSPGTGGSAGAEYLYRTLHYRFFPELWEARNCITEGFPAGHGGATSSVVEDSHNLTIGSEPALE